MKAYIIDSCPIFVEGLKHILRELYPNALIEIEQDYASALQKIKYFKFDLSISDISLNDSLGFEFISLVKETNPNSKHIILTDTDSFDIYKKSLESGIDGFMTKASSKEDIKYAIHTILSGNAFIDPVFYKHHFSDLANKSEQLTRRETEILKLIGQGKNNEEISNALYLSMSTVKRYTSVMFHKMEFRDRVEAALYSRSHLL